MSRVPISLACWDYDRTRALEDGTVTVDGVDLTYLRLPVEETFFRMLRHREFDAAEMSLASYVTRLGTDDSSFVAIPVFPSRAFRHHGIYVHTGAGIREPADLAGRVVGVPEYQLTACVWIRGILADHHDVPVASVRYRTGGMHAPGRVEKQALDLPPEIDIAPIPPDRTLADMLVTGEIDALYAPRTPRPLREGRPEVARLFADSRAAEEQYAAATGIFPIMHVVVLRRTSTPGTRGSRARCTTRSGGRRPSPRTASTRSPRTRRCSRGSTTRSSACAGCSVATSGPTASRPTGRCSRRSCATPTSRGSPHAASSPTSCSCPRPARTTWSSGREGPAPPPPDRRRDRTSVVCRMAARSATRRNTSGSEVSAATRRHRSSVVKSSTRSPLAFASSSACA